jgi:uncharacterized protein
VVIEFSGSYARVQVPADSARTSEPSYLDGLAYKLSIRTRYQSSVAPRNGRLRQATVLALAIGSRPWSTCRTQRVVGAHGVASVRRSGSLRTSPPAGLGCNPEGNRESSWRGGKLADQVSGALRTLVESRREQVVAIAARHHGSRVRLFGSAARGDDRPDSDIDLLVDFDEGSSLFDLMRMARELEALLGRSVDVVSAGGLKSRDDAIIAESVDL